MKSLGTVSRWSANAPMKMEAEDVVLAQMFCMRNGVRTRREEEGAEEDFFCLLCVKLSGER